MKQKLLLLLAISISMVSSAWALEQMGNGVYLIGTAQDLKDFAKLVNNSNQSASAILTADIDLTDETWTPIGNGKTYNGTFDGQGHTISNLFYETSTNSTGFFGQLGNGAVVKNFTIDGTIISHAQRVGVIGAVAGGTGTIATISYIHSKVNLTCEQTRHGGVLGSQSGDGVVNIDHCRYSGTFNAGNVVGNFGGIIGLTQNSNGATANITNCLFDGTINNPKDANDTNAGGIVGYTRACYCTVTNCLSLGTINATYPGIVGQINKSTSHMLFQGRNYYVDGSAQGTGTGEPMSGNVAPTKIIDTSILTNGELCVLLNNDVDQGTNWYQTLGTDDYPNPVGGDLVYKYDSYSDCNAATGTGDISYTNTPTIPSHKYTDGVCSTCNYVNPNYASKNSAGYYEIDSASKLKWFSAWVNSSSDNFVTNAVLTDDIDMTSIAATWIPIGDWGNTSGTSSAAYKGHFNGQGHAITNFNTNQTTQNYFALFGVISTGCLIENFSIAGEITNDSQQFAGSVAAYARDATPTIRNVKSAVNINNNHNSSSAHIGGVLAGAMYKSSIVKVEKCTYSGTIHTGDIAGDYGGIVGFVYDNAGTKLTISNCLFDGTVENGNSGTGICGGIIGNTSTKSTTTIENCLSVGTVKATNKGMICGYIKGTKTYTNNFYKDGDGIVANGTGSDDYTATPADTELTSGEACYLLNGSISPGTIWYQTIGTDANPVLDNTHSRVYANGTVCPGTEIIQPGTISFSNAEGYVEGSHSYTDGLCIYCQYVKSDYMTPSDGWYMIGNEKQLKWFAAYINAGNPSANAKLTANIDMTGQQWINPIGIWITGKTIGYSGHFDGQGHKIENLVYKTAMDYHGLFGVLIDGAIVENFTIYGDVNNEAYDAIAPIAYSKNTVTPVYISNIHSYLNITTSGSDKKAGGILGNGNVGTTYVDRCTFLGHISSTSKTNCGGIVAYIQNNSSTYVYISNCIFDGELESTADDAYCGGIVGYIGASSNKYKVTNCLSLGTFDAPVAGSIFGYVRNKGAGSSNNYIISGGITHGKVGDNCSSTDNLATEVTTSQLASGEIAYKLGAAFTQALGTDAYPTFASKTVYAGKWFNDAEDDVYYNLEGGNYTVYQLNLNETNTKYAVPANVTAKNVKITRNIATGKWNTFCSPVALDKSVFSEVKELTGVTDNGGGSYTLAFSDASSIVAGKPYMVKVSDAVSELTATDVSVATTVTPVTVGDITFTGVFNNGNAPEDSYIISNNKFYQVNSEVVLKAFRGYLAVGGGGEVKELNYFIEDDDADGIDMVNGEGFMVNGPIYNLSGQRINKLQKGINIVNGKKVLF